MILSLLRRLSLTSQKIRLRPRRVSKATRDFGVVSSSTYSSLCLESELSRLILKPYRNDSVLLCCAQSPLAATCCKFVVQHGL